MFLYDEPLGLCSWKRKQDGFYDKIMLMLNFADGGDAFTKGQEDDDDDYAYRENANDNVAVNGKGMMHRMNK